MKLKRTFSCFILIGFAFVCMAASAMAEENASPAPQAAPQAAPQPAAPSAASKSFKNAPDANFNVKEYIAGMSKGGHNLLIWKDPSVNLSQYKSIKLTEFGGRLLPRQTEFSYDPFIALFNSILKSSYKPSLDETKDTLLIDGAVVECNPGSRAARALVGFGAGRAGAGVVCEIFEPGKADPCVRIYTRDTNAGGNWDSNSQLNNLFSALATRLAQTLSATTSR